MFIKDVDCTKETPVVLGHPDKVPLLLLKWSIRINMRISGSNMGRFLL